MKKDRYLVRFFNFIIELSLAYLAVIIMVDALTTKVLTFNTLLTQIVTVCIGLFMLLMVLNAEIIVRKYDKYLKDTIINSPYLDSFFVNVTLPFSNRTLITLRIFRLYLYLQAVVAPKRYMRKNTNLKILLRNYDFQPVVKCYEKFLAWSYICSFLAIFILGILLLISRFVG